MSVNIFNYLTDENNSAEKGANTLNDGEKSELRKSVKNKSEVLANELLNKEISITDNTGNKNIVKLYDILKGIRDQYYPGSSTEIKPVAGGNINFSINSKQYSIGWNSELAAVIQAFLVAAGFGESSNKLSNNTFIDGKIGNATINTIKDFMNKYENEQQDKKLKELEEQANKKNRVPDYINLGDYIGDFEKSINSTKLFNIPDLYMAKQLNIINTEKDWNKLNYQLDQNNLILVSQGKKYNIPIRNILSMNDSDNPYVDRAKLKSAVNNKLKESIYPDYAEQILGKYKLEIEQTFENKKLNIRDKKSLIQKNINDFSYKYSNFVATYHINKNSVVDFREWVDGKMNELNRTIEEQNRNEKIEKKRNEVISVLKNFNGNISDIITEVSPNLGHAKAQAYIKKFNNGKVKIIDIQKSTFNGRPTVSYKLYNDGKEYHSYVDTNFDKQYNEKIIKATIKKDID